MQEMRGSADAAGPSAERKGDAWCQPMKPEGVLVGVLCPAQAESSKLASRTQEEPQLGQMNVRACPQDIGKIQ